ncbi:tetraspanin-31 A [Reticulomyxa filosa]|uniref:Tetraspanin-31 A n=1 Tax=Reticulomyxa filosa TaxID=46433 RepID=X6NQ27_RETFI|nr:tetraspanin-31 A [Reticulomyxa filosa]|eukprot:ETO27462.1 tetraspanin-31 A [Reticulomyxa filosa]
MERQNRGGSAMNKYDSKAVGYAMGREYKEPCCTRLARGFILYVNVGLSILAIVILSVGIYSFTEGHVSYVGQVNSALFALSLVLGILILGIAILGCIAAKTNSQCMLIFYVIGLCVTFIFEIVIVSLVFNPSHLKGLIKQRWDSLSDSQRSKFEEQFNCCGFDGSDTSSDGTSYGVFNDTLTTTTTSSCPGCYHEIEKSLRSVQFALGALALLMICYQMLMLCVSMLSVVSFFSKIEPFFFVVLGWKKSNFLFLIHKTVRHVLNFSNERFNSLGNFTNNHVLSKNFILFFGLSSSALTKNTVRHIPPKQKHYTINFLRHAMFDHFSVKKFNGLITILLI